MTIGLTTFSKQNPLVVSFEILDEHISHVRLMISVFFLVVGAVRIHNTTPTPIYDDLIGSIYICKDDFFIYISPYGSAQCNLASLLLLLNFHLIPGRCSFLLMLFCVVFRVYDYLF